MNTTPETRAISLQRLGEVKETDRIHWISDAGHGWLRVPRSFGIEAETIATHYSYQDKRFFYLEEDSDAPAWLDALCLVGADFHEVGAFDDRDSFVRGLNRCEEKEATP
jgi:hypothetical protein